MATSYYGGGGRPDRTTGKFQVYYSGTAPDGSRSKLVKEFTDYDQAEAFYNGMDDSASLMDVTGMPELCEAKSRVAYFSGTLLGKGVPIRKLVRAVQAEDEEQAARMLVDEAKKQRLKLDPASITQIAFDVYSRLEERNHQA